MSRIPESVITEVTERADWACECCGAPLGGQPVAFHHRKALKHGGPNTAVNLMLVLSAHHNLHQDSIHQNPARSRVLGHIISREVPTDGIGDIPVVRRELVAL